MAQQDFYKSRRAGPISYVGRNTTYGIGSTGHGVRRSFYTDVQAINTSDHPVHMLGRSRGDIGGPFTSNRVRIYGIEPPFHMRHSYSPDKGSWLYDKYSVLVPHIEILSLVGALDVDVSPSSMNTLISSRIGGPTMSNMVAMGTKAIDMVKPTNSSADTANSLAELLSERKFFSLPNKNSTVEGEYLNYMFGVAPTIGLAQDLRNAIENREAIVDQTIRDSGKLVRRKMQFDSVYTTEKSAGNGSAVPIGPSVNVSVVDPGTWTKTKSTRSRYWFSGAFTYHLPKEGVARDLALLDKLYGVRPGLDTPWELLPFSWLVDYKASAGSAISNMNSWAQEGLVMPYAYIMCQTVVETEYTWKGRVKDENGIWRPVSLNVIVQLVQKRREPANPFGFGILPGDLNAKQKSILAALGISLLR